MKTIETVSTVLPDGKIQLPPQAGNIVEGCAATEEDAVFSQVVVLLAWM